MEIPETGSLRELIDSGKVVPMKLPKNGYVQPPTRAPKILTVSTTYHRDEEGKTRSIPIRFIRDLVSTDEIYYRKVIVRNEWIKIDTAWVENPSYIILHNLGGKPFQVMPTLAEIEEAKGLIVELGVMINGFADTPFTFGGQIRPTESFHAEMKKTLYMRCKGKREVSVIVVAFPE